MVGSERNVIVKGVCMAEEETEIDKGALKYHNGHINIHGYRGLVMPDGTWAMNEDPSAIVEPQDTNPVMPAIREMIQQRERTGKAKNIGYLVVPPRTAVRLFLEGVITRKHVQDACYIDNMLIFPEIEIDTRRTSYVFRIFVDEHVREIHTDID